MWTNSERSEFLINAYQAVHQNSRSIRDRLNLNVRYSVIFFLLLSGSLITKRDFFQDEYWILLAGGWAIVIVAYSSIHVLKTCYDNLEILNHILANIETAMEFHITGKYLDRETLYPLEASAVKLLKENSHSKNKKAYIGIIWSSTGFTFFALLVAVFH